MQHFFLPKECLSGNLIIATDKNFINQVKNVLRMKKGGRIISLFNDNKECETELIEITDKEIRGEIISVKNNNAELPYDITLYQALPKKREVFEMILQKGAELGVKIFAPILTQRTLVKKIGNLERLNRILKESAEQSNRGVIPKLNEPVNFKNIKKLDGISIIADSHTEKPFLKELLPEIKKSNKINIFIGPEGGFTLNEIETAKKLGILNFSLGPRILRTETAGIAIVSTIAIS